MRLLYAIVIAGFLLGGCSDDPGRPADLLPEDTYIDLMVEMKLLQNYQKELQADSTTIDSLQRLVFEAYEVPETQFRASHRYYQQDAEQQRERISTAIERMRKDFFGAKDTLRPGQADSLGAGNR